MRVITYARYSSDLQSAASIADQQRECRQRADREGWTIVAEFSDAAISGGTAHRPGFQALRRAAKARECDVVLAEALDRLSRNQADTARLFEDLTFAGVQLVTLSEGVVNELHVGLKGTMNSIWRKDHADKTRRGLRGLVKQGRAAGGLTYGYDVVRVLVGEARGARTINEAQAAIVRRIFEEYVAGISPKRIARTLNLEGVAPPRRSAWSPSTIHGHGDRGTGILNNALYVGRLVWNRQRYVVDPETGRRQARAARRAGELETVDVPHLRIISDDLWNAAKARQATARKATTWNELRRPRHLFSGLTKCATCGGGFTVFNHDNLFCFNARERGVCRNDRRIKRQELEARVLSTMRDSLLDPEAYEDFRAGYLEELQRLRTAHVAGQASDRQRLARVERREREIVDAIADGFRSDALRVELAALEREKAQILPRLSAPKMPPVPSANLARIFREKVAQFTAALSDATQSIGAREALRRYIDRIVIPVDGLLTVVGNPAAMGLEPGATVGCGGTQPTIPPELYTKAA